MVCGSSLVRPVILQQRCQTEPGQQAAYFQSTAIQHTTSWSRPVEAEFQNGKTRWPNFLHLARSKEFAHDSGNGNTLLSSSQIGTRTDWSARDSARSVSHCAISSRGCQRTGRLIASRFFAQIVCSLYCWLLTAILPTPTGASGSEAVLSPRCSRSPLCQEMASRRS